MVRLKQFSCRRCGTTFMLRARKAYYCPECRKKHASEYVMQKRAEKDPAVKVGVGSGGNQRGKKNHQFKDGRSHYREVFDHHIDGNRKNNAPENLVKICRSCHAQVHGLTRNFGGKES